jgi:RNA polymerase sigma-70 factor (ECF subfamily)
LGVPADEAEDAMQEVFVVAFRRWDDFEGRASMRTWLFAIARRVASHDRRSRQRRDRRTHAVGANVPRALDGESQVEERYAACQLQDFLAGLDPAKREVFILADLEGFTGREVASTLGIKPNTAWSRLKAARAEFNRQFGGHVRKRPTVIVDMSPPPEVRGRVWAVLVPQLGIAGKAAGAGAATLKAWTMAFNLKLFGATVGVGLGTVAAVHVATAPAPVEHKAKPKAAAVQKKAAPPQKVQRPEQVPARVQTEAQGGDLVPPVLPEVAPPPEPAVPIQRPAALQTTRAPPKGPTLAPEAKPQKFDPLAPDLTGIDPHDLDVMQRARAALRTGKPHNALLLVEEHARRFPGSRLNTLRQVTRIESLCAAGKKPQGIGEASALLKRVGHNKRVKRRIQKACGLKMAPEPPPSSKVAMN